MAFVPSANIQSYAFLISFIFRFVSYIDSFEASDIAIECMHNQFLCNRQILVQYAFKKPSDESGQTSGASLERHGSKAERLLAASRSNNKIQRLPNTLFATSATPVYGTTSQMPLPPVPAPPPLMPMITTLPPLPPPPLPPR